MLFQLTRRETQIAFVSKAALGFIPSPKLTHITSNITKILNVNLRED